jgi:hypothetical protein
MPYKNKAEANAVARRRWKEDPTVRERHKASQDNWEENNKEERNEYRANWARMDRVENIVVYHEKELIRDMKKYGTTVEWFRDKLIEQYGVCAICKHLSRRFGNLQRLQVDHDHSCCDLKTKSCGNCLRGLLCANCNLLLSYLEKFTKEALVTPFPQLIGKPEPWTGRAMRYLKKYATTTQETQ